MMQAIELDEHDNEKPSTISSPPHSAKENLAPRWLKPARIGCGVGYIVIVLTYLIFMIVCIALYPRCEPAAETPWWRNGVFLRFPRREMSFSNLKDQLDHYRQNFTMQAMWLGSPMRSSSALNPIDWQSIESRLGGASDLNELMVKAHHSNIRILVDYPINQLSIQSEHFNNAERSTYFVWNRQGNTSNWTTVDGQPAWTFDAQADSFYLHQFGGTDQSIDVNYRNNRVLGDLIDSVHYWDRQFNLDGFNLQGLSYAYEDFEYRDEIVDERNRTRHLDEDYLLLARLRSAISNEKVLLLDTIDSFHTKNQSTLARYIGSQNASLGGVQMLAINDYILTNETTNLTLHFDNYFRSIYRQQQKSLIWSSLVFNSTLNEAFFAACLFHTGAIAIDVEQSEQQLSPNALDRLRQLMSLTRTLDVFRVGTIRQNIVANGQWLTIERARRGARHHMIIINFSETTQKETIALTEGVTSAVEILLSNVAGPGPSYETNALIKMSEPIQLKPYEYLIIRWSPSIESLGIIF